MRIAEHSAFAGAEVTISVWSELMSGRFVLSMVAQSSVMLLPPRDTMPTRDGTGSIDERDSEAVAAPRFEAPRRVMSMLAAKTAGFIRPNPQDFSCLECCLRNCTRIASMRAAALV